MATPPLFNVFCPITESRNLIRFGQVAVSHIPYNASISKAPSAFRIIHVKRELRSCIKSMAEMYLHSETRGRKYKEVIIQRRISGFMEVKGHTIISQALQINIWAQEDNVLPVKMEDLLSSPEPTIDRVLSHVEHVTEHRTGAIWQRAKSAETLTKADKFPKIDWTDRDELLFSDIGGFEANRQLGYTNNMEQDDTSPARMVR